MKHCTICKEKYDDSISFCPVDGEVLEDDPSSLVNTVLDGQYQMEKLLGKGGMGAVYAARHILLGDRVAIKVLPPEVRNNAEWLRRFRREGQAARRFRHPNAVTVYDLRTAADGTIYMVMEFVEGHTLDAELKKRGRFTAPQAVELLTPIMSVLDTAHSMGVVHRDLKPENIMVGNPGNDGVPVIKLLDLGIAKMREIAGVDSSGNTALTTAGQVLGTPYYMSPEQWGEIPRDGSVEIDGRADIYSLGLVFYEMVAGRRCYSAATLHELRRDHISTTPKALFEMVPGVPKAFSDTIQRATAKDRGDRQSTASQLAAELKASLNSPTGSGPVETAGSLAATIAASGNVVTNADVTAPTVLEMGPAQTGAGSSSTAAPPRVDAQSQPIIQPPPPQALVPPPAGDSKTIASVLTVPRAEPRAEPGPPPEKSKIGLIVGVALLLIVLLAGGGIGLVFLLKSKTTSTTTTTKTTDDTKPTAPVSREVARYWLELDPKSGNTPLRVAGLVPLASGQSFKMHFVFPEEGYLYLIGPGPDANKPTAFLTSKPSKETGIDSNKVEAGTDMSFPSGSENWLTLDKNPGTEYYTLIFSKTQLTSESFLNVAVTGQALGSDERDEMNKFIAKYQGQKPSTDLDQSDLKAPFARVKAAIDPEKPLIFDIKIQHK